jgi:TonB family protein
MNGSLPKLLAVLLLFSGACAPSRAQNPNASTQENVGLTKLFQPIYPPVAKQAGVKGDVELELKVNADGSLESATVVSGHPLLTQALDSAKYSQFECRGCAAEGARFRILYSFQLGPTSYCTNVSAKSTAKEKQETYPHVTQEQNHITLIDQPVGTCDLAFKVVERKVRSIKCVYLWRCGLTDWHEQPVAGPPH